MWAGCSGILDSWDHREVMIKCDQGQSWKSLAEMFREPRRPRSRMVENTHCDMKGLARTRRSDPIERTGASVDVKLLLTSWLRENGFGVRRCLPLMMPDSQISNVNVARSIVGESLNEAICCFGLSVRIQAEMESRWKADGVFMEKLDLPDEVIVGGEKMRIADDSVCYSIAISACVKEPNSLMALALFKKTDQCSMLKDQIVFNTTISACDKSMFWTMVLHLLYQMQDTELRKNGCNYSVAITACGNASHWNTALKLLKEEKEHDGDVSNTIMDNTMCNLCEKADQNLIKLKTLVEHG